MSTVCTFENTQLRVDIVMEFLLPQLLVTIVITLTGVIATAEAECSVQYEAAVQEVLKLKRECKLAALYDCCETAMLSKLVLREAPSGVYEISNVCKNKSTVQERVPFGYVAPVAIPNSSKMYAVCNMDTDRGGWMVIQRRIINGLVDFYRNWTQYEEGFGDLDAEFWYGLNNLHYLSTRYKVVLRIDLRNTNGDNITWVYQNFTVAGPGDKYRLNIGNGQGPGFDSMAPHNNAQFSTYDHDNDGISSHCAVLYKGGWWYHRSGCYGSNLNGPHVKQSTWDYIAWQTTNGYPFFPDVTMMVRPKNCKLTESPQCPEKD